MTDARGPARRHRAHRPPAAADPAARRRLLDAPPRPCSTPRHRRAVRGSRVGSCSSPTRRRPRPTPVARRPTWLELEHDPALALVPRALRRTSNGLLRRRRRRRGGGRAIAGRHAPRGAQRHRVSTGLLRRRWRVGRRSAPSSTTPSPSRRPSQHHVGRQRGRLVRRRARRGSTTSALATATAPGRPWGPRRRPTSARRPPSRRSSARSPGLRRLVGRRARRGARHPGAAPATTAPSPWSPSSARSSRRAPSAAPGRRLPGAHRRRRRRPGALRLRRRARGRRARATSRRRRARPPVGTGEELVIVVPSGAEAPVLRLDDGDDGGVRRGRGHRAHRPRGRARAALLLPATGRDGAGEHTLTMAFLGSDGDLDLRRIRPLRRRLEAARGPKRRPSWPLARAFTRLPRRVRDILRSPPRLPHGGHLRAHRRGPRGPRSSGVGSLLRPTRPQAEKYINYESGVDPVGSGWGQSQVRYYIFALLFVMFDVEAVFIFPFATRVEAYDVVRPRRDGRSSS